MTNNSDGSRKNTQWQRIQRDTPALDLSSPALQQHQPGIYGEADRATFGIELVPAKSMQYRRLSAQPEFVYYLPYLPLAVCPDAPDVMAEYVQAQNIWVKVTHWKLDHQLIPTLAKRDIDTGNIFGIPRANAWEFFNFANGVVIQDSKSDAAYRIYVHRHTIIEPAVSMARPAEKILANYVEVFSFAVQTVSCLYFTAIDHRNPKCFKIVKQEGRDIELWRMMMLYQNSMDGTI